jgi:hypothetical protein
MRANIYNEEMSNEFEFVEREVNGQKFTGVRFLLKSPEGLSDGQSAVTFWADDPEKLLTLLGRIYGQLADRIPVLEVKS